MNAPIASGNAQPCPDCRMGLVLHLYEPDGGEIVHWTCQVDDGLALDARVGSCAFFVSWSEGIPAPTRSCSTGGCGSGTLGSSCGTSGGCGTGGGCSTCSSGSEAEDHHEDGPSEKFDPEA